MKLSARPVHALGRYRGCPPRSHTGSLEFVGRLEEHGWTLAATIVPIAYTAWSLWLRAAGVLLLT